MKRAGLRESPKRQAAFWIALTWVPLLLLSLIGGNLRGGDISFIEDFPVHVRLLLAMPLLIFFERVAETRLAEVIPTFRERGMITLPEQALSSTLIRIRNLAGSLGIEILLIVAAFALIGSRTLYDPFQQVASWRAIGVTAELAEFWYRWVSLIAYHLLLLRWMWKYVLWSFFLILMARSRLNLEGHHPDKMGGLEFLIPRHLVFVVIASAMSMVLSANIGAMAIQEGEDVLVFQFPILAYLAIMVITYFAPLLVFTPPLIRIRRRDLETYGTFGARHAMDFRNKWAEETFSSGPSPLGCDEISTNTDLNSSYEYLYNMQMVLFTRHYLFGLCAYLTLPFVPLLLFKIPLLDLLRTLVRALM